VWQPGYGSATSVERATLELELGDARKEADHEQGHAPGALRQSTTVGVPPVLPIRYEPPEAMGIGERTTKTSDSDRTCFYRAALAALRYVEHRRPTGRRFGADADARWGALRGHLATADRVDLLLRDADREWIGAFGPRTVFGLTGLAEDEPFGGEWAPLDPVAAEELWRSVVAASPPADVRAAVEAIARAWDLGLQPTPAIVTPSDKLLVVGPSAATAAITAFAGAAGLDWADQVLVLATPPAHRQLAALGAALVNATKGTAFAARDAHANRLGAGRRLLVSDDADPNDAALARELVR
jgi:hypothetical protein